MVYSEIEERYNHLEGVIKKARHDFPLAAPQVTLLAVTKQQPIENIASLIRLKHRFYAENRVAEAAEKWPELKKNVSGIELHLIGPLQTNKARQAVALFDVIETLDRNSLADALDKEAKRAGKKQRCYIQVNIGEESQKSGVLPSNLPALYRYAGSLSFLSVEGLMCIPPEGAPPAPYFACMRSYQQQLGVAALSMGMSGDFETAIRFGATHVRIGTALLGART